MKPHEQYRGLHAVDRTGTLRDGSLEPIEGEVQLTKPGIHIREVIWRHIAGSRAILQLLQYVARLLRLSCETVRLTELREPDRSDRRQRGRFLQLRNSFVLATA